MFLGLLVALAASVCYGVATVLQARSARATPRTADVDPRLLLRLSRQLPFAVGLALDGFGFGLQFVALRLVPVFVVQAAMAASLAVTAVVAVPLLGVRLTGRDWSALAMVCGGLALLGISAGAEGDRPLSLRGRLVLLGCVGVLALTGYAARRLPDMTAAAVLGAVGGLGFGLVALAVRALSGFTPARLLADPAVYALAGGGLVAFVFYASALQRGAVTVTTAAILVGETTVPAAVGVAVLGDRVRAGYQPVAAGGFLLALAGALLLARLGQPVPAAPDGCGSIRTG